MMPGLLESWSAPGRLLLIAAAPKEAMCVARARRADPDDLPGPWRRRELDGRFDLVESGVGKANAASCAIHAFDPARHAGVVSVGVAGALPGGGPAIGDLVVADRSVYADEGAITPDGFVSVGALGFPPGGSGAKDGGSEAFADAGLLAAVRTGADTVGPIACVSTCSGTDAHAHDVRDRTGAIAEAMEGAAIGFACLRLADALARPIPFLEVRAISNTTGDRSSQRWDLRAAFERLERFLAALD